MIDLLVGVLCLFRERPVAVIGDMECMFHRFKVNPDQRKYLQLLWRRDGNYQNSNPITYQMTLLLFGATSFPGWATYGLKRIAIDNADVFGHTVTDFLTHDCTWMMGYLALTPWSKPSSW